MYYIFGLFSHSEESSRYLVIFNQWYEIPAVLNTKFDTRLLYFEDGYVGLFCSFLKHDYLWKAPWLREKYKEETLKNYEWVDLKKVSDWDTFKASFKMNKDGARVTNKATVTGYKSFYSICWFPRWLKNLYNKQYTEVHIQLSYGIGKNERTSFYRPYRKNLVTSWVLFEQLELPKYLRGER